MVVSATQLVDAAAIVHPAFIEVSDADKVAAPLFLIDTKDEDKATMDKFTEALKKKPFGEKVQRKRFDDTFHGFCAGRANYGDEKNAKYANEVRSGENATNIRPTLTLLPSSRRTCLEATEMYRVDRSKQYELSI
jgi:dienelactone hydrolase